MSVSSDPWKEVGSVEDLILSLGCVMPIFLLICFGCLIRCTALFPPEVFDQLSSLCFRFLIPCLLFYNIYNSDLTSTISPGLLTFLVGQLLIWFLFNYILFTRTQPDHRRRGAYIQAAYRSNIAVIGVTLAQSMMTPGGVAAVTMAVAILVPIYNVLAVITLETCRGGQVAFAQTAKSIAKNPLIISCALGIAALVLGIELPTQVESAIRDLGSAGSTLTLVALGASLRLQGLHSNVGQLVWCSLYRLVAVPLVALTAAALLGFRGDALATVLVCTAAPMASSSFPMALAYDSDHELTGQVIVTTAVFCSFTLFLWIFLLKRAGLI